MIYCSMNHISILCHLGLLSTLSPLVELSLGSNWRDSTDVNKGAGSNTTWNTNMTCKTTSSQLRRDPIKVQVTSSGRVVGQGSVTVLPLLVTQGKISKIKCDIKKDNNFAGTVYLYARFTPDSAALEKKTAALAGDAAAVLDAPSTNQKQKDQMKAVRIYIYFII